jgi:hypothetical protein
MKCPNALKTQSKCGKNFQEGKKKKYKILKSWKQFSERRGNCNNEILPMILTFDMTRIKKLTNQKKC